MGLKTGGGQIILKSNLDFTIKLLIMFENLISRKKTLEIEEIFSYSKLCNQYDKYNLPSLKTEHMVNDKSRFSFVKI